MAKSGGVLKKRKNTEQNFKAKALKALRQH